MHSLLLAADRTVYSTGVNDEGALGRHTGVSSMLPINAYFPFQHRNMLQAVATNRAVDCSTLDTVGLMLYFAWHRLLP